MRRALGGCYDTVTDVVADVVGDEVRDVVRDQVGDVVAERIATGPIAARGGPGAATSSNPVPESAEERVRGHFPGRGTHSARPPVVLCQSSRGA